MTFAEVKEMAKTLESGVVVKTVQSKMLNNGSFVPDSSTTKWEIMESREPEKSDAHNIAYGYLKFWTIESFKGWAYNY